MENTPQIIAILMITALPLLLAVIAYRLLPSLDIRIGGEAIRGIKMDATGAVAVYVFTALLSWSVWDANRPASHPRWEVFTLHGKARLPDDFDPAEFRGAQVQLVLNPPTRIAMDDLADGLFDWNVKVPVRVDADGRPQWENADWGFREIKLGYPPPVPAEQQARRLIAPGINPASANFAPSDDGRSLALVEPIVLRPQLISIRADGGQDGVIEARLEEEVGQ